MYSLAEPPASRAQIAAYRNGSAYQLWQLHRLAKEPDCQKLLLDEDAVTTLVPLLTEPELAMGSASVLQRLASKEGADKVLKAGKHPWHNDRSAQRPHALTASRTCQSFPPKEGARAVLACSMLVKHSHTLTASIAMADTKLQ